MSLSQLESRLRDEAGTHGVLHLTPTAFPELAEVLAHLRVPSLLLRSPEVGAAADGALSFTGEADLLGGTGARISIDVRGDAADQAALTLPLADGWRLEDAFPGLPPSLRADAEHPELPSLQTSLLYDLRLSGGTLKVRKAAEDGAPAGIAFTGRTRFPAGLQGLAARLVVDESAAVSGTAVLSAGEPARVDVLFPSGTPPLELGTLRVEGTGLHVRTRSGEAGEDARTVVEYEGTMDIGDTDPLTVDVIASYGMDNDRFTIVAFADPAEATLLRGVDAVAEWAGGGSGDFAVPEALRPALASFGVREVAGVMDMNAGVVRHLSLEVDATRDWPIVEGLTVTEVRFGWLVLYPFVAERTLSSTVAGTLEFGTTTKVRFDVLARASGGFTVTGELRAGDRIDLTELIETGLGFTADLPAFAVDSLEIEAGTTGDFLLDGRVSSDWSVDVGGKPFAVERISFLLEKSGGTTLAQLYGLSNVAGSQLYLRATVTSQSGGATGVEFEGGTLPTGDPISLTGVANWALELFGASLPSEVPDVTLKNLDLRFNTATKEFHFQGETDVPIEVPFLPGDDNRIHAAANLTSKVDSATGRRTLEGWMEGDLVIGPSTFKLRYAMGQTSHVFQASWEQAAGAEGLGINTLLETIGAPAIDIPAGVDLDLKRVYFEYQAELGAFTLVADSATYGEAFLLASRPADPQTGELGSGWSFVFGLQYDASKLSQVPVLGSGMDSADVFHFEELGILIASGDVASFTLPQLPPLQTTDGTGGNGTGTAAAPRKPVAAGTAVPLKAGISFIGIVDFEQSQSGGSVDSLRSVLPSSRLTITAGYDAGAHEFMLTGILDGAVVIPTGGASDLRIANARLQLGFPALEFRLSGSLDFAVDHQPIHVEPALAITETEAAFSVDLDFGAGGWTSPMGIQGLALDEVGFKMGVVFAPPGVSLGMEGAAHVGREAPKSDQFAFVLEMVEEVPNPLLLSFQIAELSVEEALSAFVPGVSASDLPPFVREIRFTDLAFYWADSIVALPDGTLAQPGLRFRGNLQVMDFAAHAAVSIDSSGMMGEIMLSPVHLGDVLSITGAGQGVYRYERDGKAVMPAAVPEKNLPAPERVAVVAPGGAVAQFRTQQSPWLYASIDVSLFGTVSESIEALVSAEGVHFKLVFAITGAVSAELECTASKSGFKAHAQFGLHLKADLGPIRIAGVDLGTIHLDAGFDLEMTVEITAQRFLLQVSGDFEFEGARLTFPTLKIDLAPASLAELPERLIAHLGENLEEIFADLFADAAKLLEEAGKEIAAAAEAVAKEVEQIEKAAVEEAEQIAKDAEEAVTHAAEAVANEAERVEQEAVKIASDAMAEVEQIGTAAVQEVERVVGEIADVAQKAAHEVEAIGREIEQEAKQVEQAVAQLASEAAQQVEAIAHAAEQEVRQLVADAQRVAGDIVNAARAVVSELERQAQALWDEARRLAEEIAEAARKAEQAVENTAKKAWHAIKKY